MINILIIEDDTIVRHGIRLLLDQNKDIRIVGEAGNADLGMKLAREKTPDVILLDLHLPDGSGLSVARKLLKRLPDTKILVLTAMSNQTVPAKMIESGVHGYLNKNNSPEELIQAIRKVHSGQRYLSPEMASELALGKTLGQQSEPFKDLSDRELEVLVMLASGMTINDIAKHLSVSPKTVSTYRYRMHAKLGVKNDLALIKLAIDNHLVDSGKVD